MPEMIDTSTMPGDMMDPDAIDGGAGKLRTVGSNVSTQGGTVLTSWQKISASYHAPEENTLFHAMNPVKTAAEKVGTDTDSAATALETFAEEVRTIKTAVAQIRKEAAEFKASVADGVEVESYNWKTGTSSYTKDWHEDQASVDKNNALISRTNAQQEALWKAERTCANAILALVGADPISAASESNPHGYGVDSIPDGTDMPWGAKVERTEDCGEGIVHGAVNGVSSLTSITNLFGLKNSGEGLWGWDWKWDWSGKNAGDAWLGLSKFVVGAATFGPGGSLIVSQVPGPVGDYLRDSQKTFVGGVAGLVAIDMYADDPLHNWKEHGWRALGESGFNVATIFVAPAKVGQLGKLGKVGEVALNVTDPLYLATKAMQGMKTMVGPTAEALSRLNKVLDFDNVLGVTRNIEIDMPSVSRDGIHTDLPNTPDTDLNVPPARDLPEMHDRHGSDGAPEQTPVHGPDREPALVGGRGGDVDGTSTSHGGGEATSGSTGGSAGRGSDDLGGRNDDGTPTGPDHTSGGRGDSNPASGPDGDPRGDYTHGEQASSGPHGDGDTSVSAHAGEGHASQDGAGPQTDSSGNPHTPDSAHQAGSAADNEVGHADSTNGSTTSSMHVPDQYSHLDRHDLDSGTKGDWTKELHRPEPNSVYVVDDRHLFVTDDRGRVVHVETTLDTTPGDRNGYQQRVSGREYRLEIDQGGHLVATRFGGPGEGINLVPMSKELNGAGKDNWYAMEEDWARTLDQDPPPEIKVKIDIGYEGISKRPEEFAVSYSVDGSEPILREFEQ